MRTVITDILLVLLFTAYGIMGQLCSVPGQYGQDCSCQSPYPPFGAAGGSCANGTWAIPGPLRLPSATTWDINLDTINIQGDFSMAPGSVLLVHVNLTEMGRSGFLAVSGLVDIPGTLVAHVVDWNRSYPSAQVTIPIMSFRSRTASLPWPAYASIVPRSATLVADEQWIAGEGLIVFDVQHGLVGLSLTLTKGASSASSNYSMRPIWISTLLVTSVAAF